VAGLSLALILIGIVLLFAWRHTVRKLSRCGLNFTPPANIRGERPRLHYIL